MLLRQLKAGWVGFCPWALKGVYPIATGKIKQNGQDFSGLAIAAEYDSSRTNCDFFAGSVA
jgi:hypothetical protein